MANTFKIERLVDLHQEGIRFLIRKTLKTDKPAIPRILVLKRVVERAALVFTNSLATNNYTFEQSELAEASIQIMAWCHYERKDRHAPKEMEKFASQAIEVSTLEDLFHLGRLME